MLGAQFQAIALRCGGIKEQTVYFAKEKKTKVGKVISSFLVSDGD